MIQCPWHRVSRMWQRPYTWSQIPGHDREWTDTVCPATACATIAEAAGNRSYPTARISFAEPADGTTSAHCCGRSCCCTYGTRWQRLAPAATGWCLWSSGGHVARAYVSSNHGVIARTATGWTITDNGTTNGTYVNGARLAPGTPVAIAKGNSVRIATLEFTVE